MTTEADGGKPTETTAPDWPPRASAVDLPDGTQRYGSTGQLFEVRSHQWVRVQADGGKPTPQNGDGSDGVIKTWVIINEPGRVPEKKYPTPQTWEGVDAFLWELIGCRPKGTEYVVAQLTWDHDLWVEDGHERLVMAEHARPGRTRKKILQRLSASR